MTLFRRNLTIPMMALLVGWGATALQAQCQNSTPRYRNIIQRTLNRQFLPPTHYGQHPVIPPTQPVQYPVAPPTRTIVQRPVQAQPTQPVKTTGPSQQAQVDPSVARARQLTKVARTHFVKQEYLSAIKMLDEVCKLVPEDTNAYQFRSLAKFAAYDLKGAAADAYDAIKLGNTWNREVVDKLYNAPGRYNSQLKDLKETCTKEPTMAHHFLLAYHHLIGAEYEAGAAELEKVLAISPQEPVSQQLLAAVQQRIAQTNANTSATADAGR